MRGVRLNNSGGEAHGEEPADNGQEGAAIKGEAHTLAKLGHQQPGQGWAENPGRVDQGRVQGNCARQVVSAHDLHQKTLPGGHLECLNRAGNQGQGKDLPGSNPLTHGENPQHEGLQHGQPESNQNDPVTVEAVGNHSGQQPEQQGRYLTGKGNQPEHQGGLGQPIDQPGLGHVLHPESGPGNKLTDKKEAKIPMAERSEGIGQGITKKGLFGLFDFHC